MFSGRHAFEISAEPLAALDAAIKMILDQGLAVVIDLHPESDLKIMALNRTTHSSMSSAISGAR